MKHGIYDNLDFLEYRSKKEFVSISELNLFLKLPSLYKHQILNGNKEVSSKQQDEGTAVHAAILEPQYFEKTYRPLPEIDGRTKEGKILRAHYEELEENEGKKFLKLETYNRVAMAANTLKSHKQVMGRKIKAELSFFSSHKESKVDIKSRIDGVVEEDDTIIDVKTTVDALNFQDSVFKYGYHRQAVFYQDIYEALTGKQMKFQWWVVEMQPPYTSAVYDLSYDLRLIARDEYERGLFEYKKCRDTNIWPGIPEEVRTISVPSWYLKKTESKKIGEKENGT